MADLSVVGKRMLEIASGASDMKEIDAFGRSAINRYYYAAFLLVREVLGSMDQTWRGTKHGQIPELLSEAVMNRLNKQIQKLGKSRAYSPAELQRWRQSASLAVRELTALMDHAYAVRVVADYEPEISVDAKGGALSLGSCKVSASCHWPARARTHSQVILKVWQDVGL